MGQADGWQGHKQLFNSRGKHSITGKNPTGQMFMTPTQCKEERPAKSLGMALSWQHSTANGGSVRVAGADQGFKEGAGARTRAEGCLVLSNASALWGPKGSSQLGPYRLATNR